VLLAKHFRLLQEVIAKDGAIDTCSVAVARTDATDSHATLHVPLDGALDACKCAHFLHPDGILHHQLWPTIVKMARTCLGRDLGNVAFQALRDKTLEAGRAVIGGYRYVGRVCLEFLLEVNMFYRAPAEVDPNAISVTPALINFSARSSKGAMPVPPPTITKLLAGFTADGTKKGLPMAHAHKFYRLLPDS